MNKNLLPLAALLLGLAAFALVGLALWQRTGNPPPQPAAVAQPGNVSVELQPPASAKAANLSARDWKQNLERILSKDGDSSSVAQELFAAMPGLPVQALDQYVPHALDRCEDGEFSLAEKVYFDPGMPSSVKQAVFEDALNRPDEVKLPLMAKTLGSPKHSMVKEARELLESYLRLDPGAVPADSWEIAVKKYLENNSSISAR